MEEPKYIENFSTKELEEELELRKKRLPALRRKINWSIVEQYVNQTITNLQNNYGLPKDFEHSLMEIILETMYEDGIFLWWNHQVKDQ